MNLKYIEKLIKTNRPGKVIKLMIDNVNNWSIKDFQTICDVIINAYRLNWRLYFFIKRYFTEIYIKEIEFKYVNRMYRICTVEYWSHYISNEHDYHKMINRYRNITEYISIFKYCMNNKNIQSVTLMEVSPSDPYNISYEVLKYLFSPKHINMFCKLSQKNISRKIRSPSYPQQIDNIKLLLSEKINTCYNTFKSFNRLLIITPEILRYFLSNDIKHRIPILYNKAVKKLKKI